eukprot:CAMPEP_0176037740 /NCGR_PEP_ID=MMETSP0120_2-20121206/18699_1 /TAXON_ID=160619 /ORGANISM="Kryptoperidinium foliaceum, Strain CCMP 1326" /LENGTH=450 /DNA_ID=CAMNT_0017371131 /DNA_START=120 /DNA_END=1472 /DNA_ORIENTATION=+
MKTFFVLLALAPVHPHAEQLPSIEALLDDDACSSDVRSESCAIALRQLRGQTSNSALGLDDMDAEGPPFTPERGNASAGADESGEEANSFCCYSGAVASDVCGSCYPTAIAETGSFCASKGNCGGCGGTWCKRKFQCVFSGEDPSNVCGTAYPTAIAGAGSFCGRSEQECSTCRGTWCAITEADAGNSSSENGSSAEQRDSVMLVAAASTRKSALVNESADASNESGNETGGDDAGFCCYSGASSSDMCGTCYPSAIAEAGSFCAKKDQCGGCGGTWCRAQAAAPPAAQCVFASDDPQDVCGTAYSSAIAESGSWCAASESQCSECKGTWCSASAGNASEPEPAEDAEEENGLCCHSAAGSDVCGTCRPAAMASTDSLCASKSRCGGCGGTWCNARWQCVFAGDDAGNVCATAYPSAIAQAGTWCAESERHCGTCLGTWCDMALLKTSEP